MLKQKLGLTSQNCSLKTSLQLLTQLVSSLKDRYASLSCFAYYVQYEFSSNDSIYRITIVFLFQIHCKIQKHMPQYIISRLVLSSCKLVIIVMHQSIEHRKFSKASLALTFGVIYQYFSLLITLLKALFQLINMVYYLLCAIPIDPSTLFLGSSKEQMSRLINSVKLESSPCFKL